MSVVNFSPDTKSREREPGWEKKGRLMQAEVDRLASLGMVERVQDPGHLGGFLIRLTKKGE